ncbi:MAG: tetratricopeptide repeat protein [Pseudomonadota bacterium]
MSQHPPFTTTTATADTLLLQIAALVHGAGYERGLQLAEIAIAQDLHCANLYHLAGVCAVHLGLRQQAEDYWRLALAASPVHAGAHANLAVLLHELQRHEEAEAMYRSALQLDAANAYLHARFAGLLALRRQGLEAEHHYRRALALDPADAATQANLGVLLTSAGRSAEAEQWYRQALTLAPDNAATHVNLGLLLARQGQRQAAQQCYARALELEPGNASAFSNLGLLLEQHGNDELAGQCHRKAAALAPGSADVLYSLGNFLAKIHQYQEAEQVYRQAIAAEPASAITAAAYTGLGVLHADTLRAGEAEASFRQAMLLDATYPLAATNLAVLLLQQGRYAEAWPYHEARHDPLSPKPVARPPVSCGPLWQGQDIRGKSVLVWPEQGLGDMLQFCRYVPLLKQRGAAQVTLVCYPELHALLSTLAGVDACLRLSADLSLPKHDYCVLTMSLPGYLQTAGPAAAILPYLQPYLQALPQRSARWARRLQDNQASGSDPHKLRIGLAWKGNPSHANDAERSLDTLDRLAPLWSIPGILWVSLQKNDTVQAAPAALGQQAWLPLGHELEDLADTAAIVATLDLVICVDTSVAHLAGALGKRCWTLLPAYKTDWRWLQAGHDTAWYPGTMRLFRQPYRSDWTSPVNEIAVKLRAWLVRGSPD